MNHKHTKQPNKPEKTANTVHENAGKDTVNDAEIYQKAQDELASIRAIINAKAIQDEQQKHQEQAREYVSKVFTEALHDRQQQDASVSKMLVPIVENSIQKTITQHRKQFTDTLYPLVGDLVRKFTTALLRDFIEKTNELIEKSVTFKSIGWRFKAWKAGVSYSHFVASQTYLFQIQQVLLIHRDTGLLLNSASITGLHDENSDLVSSMLTAINDFVADSFSNHTSGEQLDEIKTDNFTLYLRKGPHAYLVAAVTGNISPRAKTKLQTTLEYIHSLYGPQLQSFNGDTGAFEDISAELGECLLSEEKQAYKKKKKPYLAIILITIITTLLAWWLILGWQTSQALARIQELEQEPGIVILRAEHIGVKDINLQVLRDPDAINLETWIQKAKVDDTWLTVSEIPFISMSNEVINKRIEASIKQYPELQFDAKNKLITGPLNQADAIMLRSTIDKIVGIAQYSLRYELEIAASQQTQVQVQQALNIVAGEISQLQLTFASASAVVTEAQKTRVKIIAEKFLLLQAYAQQLGLQAKLLIVGTSDNVGNVKVNQLLSLERAEQAKQALLLEGVAEDDMFVSGIGSIDVKQQSTNMRKAIINVVYNPL